MTNWILDGHTPVECDDIETWGKWFEEDGNRRVALSVIERTHERVSTVFLGIDHGFSRFWLERTGAKELPPPILFETMIFGGTHDCHEWRYVSWDEAVAGHRAIVACLEAGIEPTLPEADTTAEAVAQFLETTKPPVRGGNPTGGDEDDAPLF